MSMVAARAEKTIGEPLWFLHNLARILIDDEDAAGRFALVELTGGPGDIPPLHIHHDEDETFYVLEGELELHVAGREPCRVAPGRAGFAPCGVPHVYRVVSPGPARWLAATTGAGFACFVREVAVPAEVATLPPDVAFEPAEVTRIAAAYGIEIVAPPGTLP